MEEIIGEFISQKNYRCSRTGEALPKSKRMDSMYSIVTNNVYGKDYSKSERILAAEFIKQILEEDEK
jgi:hypothetical protein